jgi:hypothetical protein
LGYNRLKQELTHRTIRSRRKGLVQFININILLGFMHPGSPEMQFPVLRQLNQALGVVLVQMGTHDMVNVQSAAPPQKRFDIGGMLPFAAINQHSSNRPPGPP